MADWLNVVGVDEIVIILKEFGEECFFRWIVWVIVEY